MIFRKDHDTDKKPGTKTKRKTILFSAVLVAVVSVAVVLSALPVCYAVSVNGRTVTLVSSREEADEAVESARLQAAEILGDELLAESSINVSLDLGEAPSDPEQIKESILENIDGLTKSYAVVVNEQAVGAADTAEELQAILDELAQTYNTQDTAACSILEDVTIDYRFVSENLTRDPDDIRSLLSPENASSPYSLTIQTVDYTDETFEIPFETEYVYDDTVFDYITEVIREGKNGSRTVTSKITSINGTAAETSVYAENVTAEPVPELILVGTKEGYSTGSYIWPTEGIITSYFGLRDGGVGSSNHKGLDIAGSHGQDIHAADGGIVVYAGELSGYGLLVQIQHDNGDLTYYAHMSAVLVNVGDIVAQGDVVGLMGMTGVASGTHLHFEVRPGGDTPADPLNYLP